ncbi:MAG: hypothetical protein JOZ18_07235 [Chloroflexi bacterium]|nr:hypothetical protein [Chloroflexota bacterium]
MREAAVERLAKLITDPPTNDSDDVRKPMAEIHLGLAEGWFSLILLATVVYSTIWSVQAAGWVENLNILTLTTAPGLICGVIAAKQQRFPPLPVHIVAAIFGLLLAFWQTAGAFYHGDTGAFAQSLHRVITIAFNGGSSDDDSIFLFFIVALSFILAYTSAWLVYRTRSPWLMVVANAVVLLINLSNLDSGYIVFLVVFLIASLLLLLRFNLYESVCRWQRQGLRYGDDIGWDVMQAGALISIGILILSWILPAGYTDATAAQLWNVSSNPWVQAENTWNRLISLNGIANAPNHGNFRDTLVLAGNPNLNHDVVFNLQTDGNGSQYLQFLSYDTYDAGHSSWQASPSNRLSVKANQVLPPGATLTHPEKQTITVVNPPGEQYPYISGASGITSMSIPAYVLFSDATGEVVGWLSQNGNLPAGTSYTVVSAVSSADEKSLSSIPMPANAPRYDPSFEGPLPVQFYNPNVLEKYLQLPNNLDPQIAALAKRITANAPTMYDKVVALESYLRTHYTYSVDIQHPPGEESVSWFLFRSDNKGFCNYFASAMAIMARTLGIPARVAAGYTNGSYDGKRHLRVIYGSDAHSWTQVYFAGYGWINFEPSASFPTFSRPRPNEFSTSSTGSSSIDSVSSIVPPNKGKFLDPADSGGADSSLTGTSEQAQMHFRQQIGIAFSGLVLLILFACLFFGIWWQRLFRRYGLVTQLYGRLCLLASWGGIKIQPSQTPYEYMQELATCAPGEAPTLERLGDIYVREQWADPESKEHPRRSGEINELPGLWKRIQPHLILYVLRHPHFLRWLPTRVGDFLVRLWKHIRTWRFSSEDEDF